MASAMSSIAAAQNHGGFSVSMLQVLAACGLTLLFYIYMTRNHFVQANFGILIRLAAELTLLALVVFSVAVAVLSIYHSRVDHQAQQLSEQGVVTARKIASPLDFALSAYS